MIRKVDKFLVTGGAGFFGVALATRLLRESRHNLVTVVDNFSTSSPARILSLQDSPWIGNRLRVIEADIDDGASIQNTLDDVHILINLAAQPHVDESIARPVATTRTNVVGTAVLLDCIVHAQNRRKLIDFFRFHQVSTDEVYGASADGAFTELDAVSPSNPYAASKAAAELLCHAANKTYGLPISITRHGNTYGPGDMQPRIITLSILAALSAKNCAPGGSGYNSYLLPLHSGSETARRDFVFIEDAVRAIDQVSRHPGSVGGIYNVGTGVQTTVREVIAEVARRTGTTPSNFLTVVGPRLGNDEAYAINCRKIQALGWSSQTPLISSKQPDGLNKTIKWYEENTLWSELLKSQWLYCLKDCHKDPYLPVEPGIARSSAVLEQVV